MRTRPKIGDIIEIPLGAGRYAYAQYTHQHNEPPKYGALLRVFAGIFEERKEAFDDLPHADVQFMQFFPLGAAASRGIITIVSNQPVPPAAQKFPIFRAGTPDKNTKRVETWWLWDGKNTWRVGELTPEQRNFPIKGTCNDTLLRERILSGWRAENDPR